MKYSLSKTCFETNRAASATKNSKIAEIVKDTVPGCEIAFADGALPDKRNYRADFGKIARVLPGFRPQWNARQGARQLYEAYRSAGLVAADFEGSRYRRIDQLRGLISAGALRADLVWQQATAA